MLELTKLYLGDVVTWTGYKAVLWVKSDFDLWLVLVVMRQVS